MAGIELLLPMAYRLAFGLLRRPEEAEDAVQDATINAWRRRSTFRAGSEVRPWFLAIVANQCHRRTRTRWWRVIRLADPEPRTQAGSTPTRHPPCVPRWSAWPPPTGWSSSSASTST